MFVSGGNSSAFDSFLRSVPRLGSRGLRAKTVVGLGRPQHHGGCEMRNAKCECELTILLLQLLGIYVLERKSKTGTEETMPRKLSRS